MTEPSGNRAPRGRPRGAARRPRSPNSSPHAPTIDDVARLASVSIATVSRVLTGSARTKPATRARVEAAIDVLGYRPSSVARSLTLGSTATIGLVISELEDPFLAALAAQVGASAYAAGASVLLCDGADDPDREAAYFDLLMQRRVDGVVVATTGSPGRHARRLLRASVPVVFVNSAADELGLPSVLSDNRTGGAMAAEHLIGLGHRVIGYLAGPSRNPAAAERLAGVEAAVRGAGRSSELVVVECGDGVVGGEEATMRLLSDRPDVTGITAYTDLYAVGALRAARRLGRTVPADLSVVGFDDIALASSMNPELTTVAQPIADIARQAIEWIVLLGRHRATSGEPPPVLSRRLPVILQVRESSGPAPMAGTSAPREG